MQTEKEKKDLYHQIRQAVVTFDDQKCIQLCRTVIDQKRDPLEAVTRGLAAGMTEVGEYYKAGEYFVPELLLCSDALYAGLEILQPHIRGDAATGRTRKIILGVVQGDIHDIGKNLVKAMFIASGWKVYDLGCDVPCENFIAANKETQADAVGLSALMTTSMMAMPDVIKELHAAYPEIKVIVGGAPLSPEVAEKYDADGYAPDVVTAVEEAEKFFATVS